MPSFDWLNDVAFSQALHMDSFRLVLHHAKGTQISGKPSPIAHMIRTILLRVFYGMYSPVPFLWP